MEFNFDGKSVPLFPPVAKESPSEQLQRLAAEGMDIGDEPVSPWNAPEKRMEILVETLLSIRKDAKKLRQGNLGELQDMAIRTRTSIDESFREIERFDLL